MKHTRIGFLALLVLVLPARPGGAADAALERLARVQGEALHARSAAVGTVLGVVRGDAVVSLGFGETARGSGTVPDGRSIVRIGSISKAMTGQLLADLTLTGTAGLADPVSRFLPPGRRVADFPDRGPLLLDLATHTAGYPRDIEIADAPPVEGNPYPVLATPELYLNFLASYRPPYPPGRVASYSNYAFGLLGWLLGRAAGTSYGSLLTERLAAPLEMRDTGVELRDDQKPRFMTGYNADGTPADPWDGSEVMQGSGGVFSTADDMARWLRFNLKPEGAHGTAALLARAVYHSRQSLDAVVALDGEQPMFGIGLGWETTLISNDKILIVQKTGGFSGFLSYAAFAPGRGVGAFVAVNRLDLDAFLGVIAGTDAMLTALAPR